MEEAATPFPSEETTPPVTKIYFGAILEARILHRACLPSTGLTYIELWSQLAVLSNRTLRSPKTKFLLAADTALRELCNSCHPEVPALIAGAEGSQPPVFAIHILDAPVADAFLGGRLWLF
jgi:hypothetical protein